MASPATLPTDDKHDSLVKRIKVARAALRVTISPDLRAAILKELAASAQELCELIICPRACPACSNGLSW